MHLSTLDVALLVVAGLGAGWLGAVLGIGGGIIVVPTLVLGFRAETRAAVAVSLVAVAANSLAAGSRYVGRGLANKRLALSLLTMTSLGGVSGGLVAGLVSASVLNGVFAGVTVLTAVLLLRRHRDHEVTGDHAPDPPAEADQPAEVPGSITAAYRAPGGRLVRYRPVRWPAGGAMSYTAGLVSGLLGVGGGFLNVPAMALVMRVPMRVATATSNFMIGVTAASSLFLYVDRGDLRPDLVAPAVLGVVAGAFLGSHHAGRFSPGALRLLFALLLGATATLMMLKAVGLVSGA